MCQNERIPSGKLSCSIIVSHNWLSMWPKSKSLLQLETQLDCKHTGQTHPLLRSFDKTLKQACSVCLLGAGFQRKSGRGVRTAVYRISLNQLNISTNSLYCADKKKHNRNKSVLNTLWLTSGSFQKLCDCLNVFKPPGSCSDCPLCFNWEASLLCVNWQPIFSWLCPQLYANL